MLFRSADYNEILKIEGLDVVLIATSWEKHIEIAVAALEKGIFTAMEVGVHIIYRNVLTW